MMTNAEKKKIFEEVCHCSQKRDFFQAGFLILDVVRPSMESLQELTDDNFNEFVLEQTDDPMVKKMVDVRQAFMDLDKLYENFEDPTVEDSYNCYMSLKKITPWLPKENKLYAMYWQAHCYANAQQCDHEELRYNLLTRIIRNTSKNSSSSDSLCRNCAMIIDMMENISCDKKFEGIKEARSKINSSYHSRSDLDEMLVKLAPTYFNQLMERLKQSAPYEEHFDTYQKAVFAVDFMKESDYQKCTRKQTLYKSLVSFMKINHDDKNLPKFEKKLRQINYKKSCLARAMHFQAMRQGVPTRQSGIRGI